MRILAVIPARGGSKGVPRKNLRELCGQPLIAHTIAVAHEAGDLFARTIVSTDDEEIADTARACGAEVPFLRPAALASDNAPTVPTLKHAVAWAEDDDGMPYDWVCLLQATAPFRTVSDLEASVALAEVGDCDSVISVNQVFATHPILMKKIERGRLLPYCINEPEGTRRQDLEPPAYMRNGAIYLTRRDVLMHDGSIWGERICPYLMPLERSISIDDELDLALAQIVMEKRLGAFHERTHANC